MKTSGLPLALLFPARRRALHYASFLSLGRSHISIANSHRAAEDTSGPQRLCLASARRAYSTSTPISTMASQYSFPSEKMRPLIDHTRTPLVLISCGSFSPITYLHLRMFEMCKDWIKENTEFEVVAGFLSPVADAYKKVGLAEAYHRVEMCRLAVQSSTWISVDDWEASKPEYTRTALVLDHFQYEINEVRGGVDTINGRKVPAKISLMSGADLIQTMSEPGVWAPKDLEHILGRYGAFIVERHGTDVEKALESLQQWRAQIYTIPQLIQNDVSSTKIRNFLRKDMSIRYLIPEPALKYLDAHALFRDDDGRRTAAQSRKTSPDTRHQMPDHTTSNGA